MCAGSFALFPFPEVDPDRINVIGALSLSSATLSLVTGGAFKLGYSYTIAAYNTLSETFNGLTEGAIAWQCPSVIRLPIDCEGVNSRTLDQKIHG